MARKRSSTKRSATKRPAAPSGRAGRPSSLLDTRIVYCGDCLDQLRKLPDGCVDLIYIDPPFSSNRNYEVFWGETREKRAFDDRHASTAAYIDYMRPRCVELARMLKKIGSFYYRTIRGGVSTASAAVCSPATQRRFVCATGVWRIPKSGRPERG